MLPQPFLSIRWYLVSPSQSKLSMVKIDPYVLYNPLSLFKWFYQINSPLKSHKSTKKSFLTIDFNPISLALACMHVHTLKSIVLCFQLACLVSSNCFCQLGTVTQPPHIHYTGKGGGIWTVVMFLYDLYYWQYDEICRTCATLAKFWKSLSTIFRVYLVFCHFSLYVSNYIMINGVPP